MDKLKSVKETLTLSNIIGSDFFHDAETTYYTDTLVINILQSEFDCMDSILILLIKEKFEDCFILLRHIFETFLFFWLMTEGKLYRYTRIFRIIPKPGSARKEARDTTLERWRKERKAGNSQYKDVVNMDKGEEDDTIIVTYQWKGVFRSKEKEESGPLVPYYVFAFQRYEPETRFLVNLPSIRQEHAPRYREILKTRHKAQKILYHRYFYFESIIKNLRLNNLISDEQADRIAVHYNFFSSFLHPNKRIIRTKPGKLAFSLSPYQSGVLSELILLYLCRLQFLYLSTIISHFKEHYPKGKYTKYERQTELLNELSNELWFFDNEPSEYDIEASNMRKWWLRESNRKVDEERVFYYTDPIERLTQLIMRESKSR